MFSSLFKISYNKGQLSNNERVYALEVMQGIGPLSTAVEVAHKNIVSLERALST